MRRGQQRAPRVPVRGRPCAPSACCRKVLGLGVSRRCCCYCCFASTRDGCLSPRVCLECNPEIPVAPGEEHWLLDTSLDEVYWPCSHSRQIPSFPSGSVVKNPPANEGDSGDGGLIPGLGRSLGGGNGNPLQYSCLRNPTDRGAWQATVYRVTKSWTQLSTHTTTTKIFQVLVSVVLEKILASS